MNYRSLSKTEPLLNQILPTNGFINTGPEQNKMMEMAFVVT